MLAFERMALRRAGEDGSDGAEFIRTLQDSSKVAERDFQLCCIECALLTIVRRLDASIRRVRSIAEPIVGAAGKFVRLKEMELERVRQQRLILLRCVAQASDVASALLESLNLSEAGSHQAMFGLLSVEAAKDLVAMLESYLQAYGECSDECARLLDVIDNFESSADLAMQARRLHIEEFELALVIGALSVSVSSIIPAAMGMNVRNFAEESEHAFHLTTACTVLIAVVMYTLIRCLAGCRGIFN
jgi:hypothetical protein